MATLKVIGDILGDYQRDALQHRNRVQALRDADPALSKIDMAIRATGSKLMGLAFTGGDRAPLDARLAELERHRQARLASMNVPEYMCPRCKDTGRIGSDYCNCLRRRIYIEHYAAHDPLRSPDNLASYRFDVFNDTKELPLVKRSQNFLARIAHKRALALVDELPETRLGMLVSGVAGVGKSWLLAALARSAAEKGVDVCYIHALPFFEAYHRQRLGRPVDTTFMESARLLILDDLGSEPRTTNVTIEALLHTLIYRSEQGLPTVIATNEDNLQDRYGERVSSRLYCNDDYSYVQMAGQDLRQIRG